MSLFGFIIVLGVVVDAYGDMQQYPGSNLYQWNKYLLKFAARYLFGVMKHR